MPVVITLVVVAIVTGAWWIRREVRRQRRARLREMDFPEAWVTILEKGMPIYRLLPTDFKRELHGHIHVFLNEKIFIGCGGQAITDEVRVIVAAQACVLLLNSPGREYKTLKSILIYPSTYAARELNDDGTDDHQHRLGESWTYGPVVLAWDSVVYGASDIHDGHNVVFHEFAHQLDQADGDADGAPDLGARSRYLAWARVLGKEYQTLQDMTERGRKHVMDRYGATSPAEFFAVATETFYEKPRQMKKEHPELYDELKQFYNVDPLEWDEE